MHQTNWKPEPYAVTRKRKKLQAAEELAEAYREVDARDAGICWVTGRYTGSSPDPDYRREHHHLSGRRVQPAWKCAPERIITTCASAHKLITLGFIEVEGKDARKPIFFHWSKSMPKPYPFQIQSKRGR